MSVIYGNPIVTSGGGGVKLNIDYGSTPPSDTTKLWVPLSTKPSAVECKPELAFGSYTSAILSSQIPTEQRIYPMVSIVGKLIYIIGGGTSSKVSVFNPETGSITTKANGIPAYRQSAACASVANKIYMIGGNTTTGTDGAIIIYDTVSETTTTAGIGTNVASRATACAIGTDVYFAGGYAIGGGWLTSLYKYDTLKDTVSTLTNIPYNFSGMIAVNKKIYFFGGTNSNGYPQKQSFVYDTETKSTTSIAEFPKYIFESPCCAAFGDNIFIFGGKLSDVSTTSSNYIYVSSTVYKYSISNNTYETVGSLPTAAFASQAIPFGLDVYVFGGITDKSNSNYQTGSIQKFATNTPLTSNHLFLQEDYGYDGLWTALKSKDTDFKVKVINAYLGDSNNIAQLTNAYLYDSKDLKWKSLSGESYVADMQNALNILGVT